jgi:hypothetical protein
VIKLTTHAAIGRALNDHDLDVDLRATIGRRLWRFYVEQHHPLSEDIKIVVVEGGDLPDVINAAVGFAITGRDAEEPTYEWVEDHGLWFEVAYARSGQPPTFVFVENNDSSDPGMYLRDVYFWSSDDGCGR